MEVVARIKSDFSGKFGIPRQSGITDDEALVIFEKKFRVDEALIGIENYSHLWLIWEFSENKRENWSPTVRPPRLGGNKRVGVFATRSSFRPNAIGLSSVKLKRVEKSAKYGTYLVVSGADLMDGTPIFDVKPYLAFTDSHPDAEGYFADTFADFKVSVWFEPGTLDCVPPEKRETLKKILENDPRPSYHKDNREYSFEYASVRVRFKYENGEIRVVKTEKIKEEQ